MRISACAPAKSPDASRTRTRSSEISSSGSPSWANASKACPLSSSRRVALTAGDNAALRMTSCQTSTKTFGS